MKKLTLVLGLMPLLSFTPYAEAATGLELTYSVNMIAPTLCNSWLRNM